MEAARPGAYGDMLTRTTLRFGRGFAASSIGQVVVALQRVPGVLTVEADAVNAQALVAHDGAVPFESLFAAANSIGGVAAVVTDPCAATANPVLYGKHRRIKSVAVAAILAVVVIDLTFPNTPEKRWLLMVPAAVLWAFIMIEAFIARPITAHSSSKGDSSNEPTKTTKR